MHNSWTAWIWVWIMQVGILFIYLYYFSDFIYISCAHTHYRICMLHHYIQCLQSEMKSNIWIAHQPITEGTKKLHLGVLFTSQEHNLWLVKKKKKKNQQCYFHSRLQMRDIFKAYLARTPTVPHNLTGRAFFKFT